MPCYHPVPGWRSKALNENGKRPIVFQLQAAYVDMPVSIPCGWCVGCQLEKARVWAVRCMHEAALHDQSWFATLTYDNENLPPDGSLRPRDFVLFMKRLRKKFGEVRFLQVGEYGSQLSRPHHHALFFGLSVGGLRTVRGGENPLFVCEDLEKCWGLGRVWLGRVTFQSAGYVCRYALKKVRGSQAESHYGGKLPEYMTMSRRPGIGRGWIEKFKGDVFPSGEVIVNGVPTKPPRFYEDVAAKLGLDKEVRIAKAVRKVAASDDPDTSGKRLIVREEVKEAALRTLTRSFEI